jgi:uncharacterized protein
MSEISVNRINLMMGLNCNFKCRHCIQTDALELDDTSRIDKSVFDYIHHLIDIRPAFLGKIQLYFWGGEPLMYMNIIRRFVNEYKDKLVYVIVTNGSLLTEEIVQYLNNNDFRVALSNDGPNTDKVRRINVLENPKIVELFKKIKNREIDSVISAHNQDYRALWKYLDDKLGEGTRISMEPLLYTWDMPEDLYDFDFEAYQKQMKELVDFAYNQLIEGKQSREYLVISRDVEKILTIIEGKKPQYKYSCRQMQDFINVDLNGNMYTCHNCSDTVGKAGDDWDDMEQKYEDIVGSRDYSDCNTCPCLSVCQYGCPNARPSVGKAATCQIRKLNYLAAIDFINKLSNTLEQVDLSDELESNL